MSAEVPTWAVPPSAPSLTPLSASTDLEGGQGLAAVIRGASSELQQWPETVAVFGDVGQRLAQRRLGGGRGEVMG